SGCITKASSRSYTTGWAVNLDDISARSRISDLEKSRFQILVVNIRTDILGNIGRDFADDIGSR
ncbi:hypothetical protein Tco_1521583, partial [Tanacetum coccineum]